MATGTATLDFGAFPGAYDASVTVTGQTGIVSGSLVEAWIRPVATADHTADEHMIEPFKVFAHTIVAGTGFTITGFSTTEVYEKRANQAEMARTTADALGVAVAADITAGLGKVGGGRGVNPTVAANLSGVPDTERRVPRIYGQYTIAWAWV